jgi:hypothetical protein
VLGGNLGFTLKVEVAAYYLTQFNQDKYDHTLYSIENTKERVLGVAYGDNAHPSIVKGMDLITVENNKIKSLHAFPDAVNK